MDFDEHWECTAALADALVCPAPQKDLPGWAVGPPKPGCLAQTRNRPGYSEAPDLKLYMVSEIEKVQKEHLSSVGMTWMVQRIASVLPRQLFQEWGCCVDHARHCR